MERRRERSDALVQQGVGVHKMWEHIREYVTTFGGARRCWTRCSGPRSRRGIFSQLLRACAKIKEVIFLGEAKIGVVTHYFTHLHVAAVKISEGELCNGDEIHILGHTSNFQQVVESMEIDRNPIDVAHHGDTVGLLVIKHAREHDIVYKVT